ncbi:MAG: sulfatase-like hydrolase/transferase [Nitriliruptorales bacterium]|nr:sulfatase-like hydrolase/transferase [Nitriliruptorales bacterium]
MTDTHGTSLLERLPVHPLILAAYPVLFLWAHNVDEVFSEDVWPILAWVLAGAVGMWIAASFVYRGVRRGALLTSFVATLLLSYGHVAGEWVAGVGIGVVVLLVLVAAAALWVIGDGAVHVVTGIANVVALVLLVVGAWPLAGEAVEAVGRGDAARAELAAVFDGAPDGPVRDIYYVVLDRYPRADTLEELYGYDNSQFLGFLEASGFHVADDSLANYPKTAHSLAASLNMTYLDELEETVATKDLDDWGPVYRMLDDHRVGQLLTDAGYEYLHLGTWWQPTAESVLADRILTRNAGSEFGRLFAETTIWPAVQEVLGSDEPLSNREQLFAFTEHQFDVLDRLADDRGNPARFVFAHLTVPHEPYVFEADGTYVPAEVEAARSRTERFVPHLEYANRRIRGFVEELSKGRADDEQPIVVVQADEGPHPRSRVAAGPDYDWLGAPLSDLREKLRILNAYHLPGVTDDEIPEGITPVNTFRLIFSHYFGADLPLLEDHVYVFPDESHLYRFTEVTDRVRE